MHISLWEKESFYSPTDIIIAGSGFVGLWSAYHLKKKHPQLRITIIDRGIIPTGASTRNAGFACFGSVTELVRDAALMGEEQMLWLVEMRYRGLEQIRKVFRKKEIDYVESEGYEIIPSTDQHRYEELKFHMRGLNHALSSIVGKKKLYKFANEKIDTFGLADVGYLIRNELEGALHPGKLCQQLLQKVQGMGVTVLTGVAIERFEENENGVVVYTDKALRLAGEQLLICTNGFAQQLLPDMDLAPARGQILVTAPVANLKLKGTFHYDEGYYYFRNVGKRLLVGGARNSALEQEATTDLGITENIQQTLERFIARHILPGQPFEITDRWSGIMGMGTEKMPIIKKLTSNVYCAVRLGGMGVALAPVAGETVTELMR